MTSELDYEAELAVIIGESVRNIEAKDALSFVAGYTILNDITARDVQFMEVGEHSRLDWFSGKCQQHSTPIGPTIVTSDAISNPSDLQIKSWVNGVKRQDESTELMIRDVSELIAFVSSRVELIPGDVITTGTPEGVGGWQDVLLTEGDTVEIEIEDLGRLENTVENVD